MENRVYVDKESFNFSVNVIWFINNLPRKPIYWTITDQLLRSATSIGANIVEAKSSSSRREFIKFYEIALKSSNETKYWLRLMKIALKINNNRLDKLSEEAESLANILAASIITLKGKRRPKSFEL